MQALKRNNGKLRMIFKNLIAKCGNQSTSLAACKETPISCTHRAEEKVRLRSRAKYRAHRAEKFQTSKQACQLRQCQGSSVAGDSEIWVGNNQFRDLKLLNPCVTHCVSPILVFSKENSVKRSDNKKKQWRIIGLKQKLHSQDRRAGCLETRSSPALRVRIGFCFFLRWQEVPPWILGHSWWMGWLTTLGYIFFFSVSRQLTYR